MNTATIRCVFEEVPELRYSQAGKPFAKGKAFLCATDYKTKETKTAQVYVSAFGEIAERLSSVEVGPRYLLDCELGVDEGRGDNVGKTYLAWTVRTVAEELGSGRAARLPPPKGPELEEELPFGWLIIVPLLGLGSALAGAGVMA